MDLGLTEDQELLVESFRGLLEKEAPEEIVRSAEPLGFDAEVWEVLRGNGVVDMAVPADAGGWGAGMMELCLLASCVGAACAPAPVVEAQVASRLLAALGADGAGLLADALAGSKRVTLALHPPIDGVARLAPAAAVADVVLVSTGDRSLAIETDGGVEHRANFGSLPVGDVPVESGSVVSAGPAVTSAFATAVDEWLLLTGSALVGMGLRSLDVAAEYAQQRRAFDRPIGSFQGIAHRLADAATMLTAAELLGHEVAWLRDQGRAAMDQRACMAFAFASEAADFATYWSVHTLGGYGVMVEYEPQLQFRRARGWARVFGDADAAYLRVAHHRYRQDRSEGA